MNALYQRLKELDSTAFERLCFHLLKERLPNAAIKHVDGAGGDGGLDVFSGELDSRPAIWQCKNFPNGVKECQKQQIRESFLSATTNFHPDRWTLCLSVDMDTPAHRWFQRFAKSKSNSVSVDLWQASDIVHELTYRTAIRNEFFPNAVIDAMQLREMLLKNDNLTDEELVAVSSENVEQLIERLRTRDARFSYEVTFSSDLPHVDAKLTRPGLMATIADDKKTIQVFARDHEALRLDPPKLNFTAIGDGVTKVLEFHKTGRPLELGPGEITNLNCDLFPLLSFTQDEAAPSRIQLSQSLDTLESLPLRITLGSVVYEYADFRISRVGSDELELQSSGDLPFQMQVVFIGDSVQLGNVTFKSRFEGSHFREISKFIDALDSIRGNNHLELYNLKLGRTLIRASAGQVEDNMISEPLRRLVDDAVMIADHYGTELRYRSDIEPDLPIFERLVNLAKGIVRPVTSLRLKLKKTANVKIYRDSLFRLIRPPEEVQVFGGTVKTGQIISDFGKANVSKADMARHNRAGIGETAEITIRPAEGMRIFAAGITEAI